MAYGIKGFRFQNSIRMILLQNENGPCPLLAAANVLLLKGVISLPVSCVRGGVVSIEELFTILANRALQRCEQITQTKHSKDPSPPIKKETASIKRLFAKLSSYMTDTSDSTEENTNNDVVLSLQEEEAILFRNKQSQHMINDLMQILPQLQYGMDINPKFTQGPEGYEFTIGLTAFDVLGVDLVHGWLLPQDDEDLTSLTHVIGTKTYNELIEIVIQGNDAVEQIGILQQVISKTYIAAGNTETKEPSNDVVNIQKDDENNENTNNFSKSEASKSVTEELQQKVSKIDIAAGSNKTTENMDGANLQPSNDAENIRKDDENSETTNTLSKSEASKPVTEKSFQEKLKKAEETATKGHMVDSFLKENAHQLTAYGLEQLREHVHEGDLCVFFRNNHFSSVMKHCGQLFLLVTDLGYASVGEVIWERLDAIDGNTDYFNCDFIQSQAMVSEDFIVSSANNSGLSPEKMLALRGKTENDYQLALQLANSNNASINSVATIANEDERFIATVAEMSLQEKGNNDVSSVIPVHDKDHLLALSLQNGSSRGLTLDSDTDRSMAESLQHQFANEDASEQLARKLHNQERFLAAQRNEKERRKGSGTTRRIQPQTASESGCIIS